MNARFRVERGDASSKDGTVKRLQFLAHRLVRYFAALKPAPGRFRAPSATPLTRMDQLTGQTHSLSKFIGIDFSCEHAPCQVLSGAQRSVNLDCHQPWVVGYPAECWAPRSSTKDHSLREHTPGDPRLLERSTGDTIVLSAFL